MARVIEEVPIVEKRVVCPGCGSTIGYVQNDVQSRHGTDYGGGPDGMEWVDCPACRRRIVLRSW